MTFAIHSYFALRLFCNSFMSIFQRKGRFFKGWGSEASFDPSDWLSLVLGNFNREDKKILTSNLMPY
jgi:hypothetical protein